MSTADQKIEVEAVDENHVRLKIHDGENVISVIVRIVSEPAVELIEANRSRRITTEPLVAA